MNTLNDTTSQKCGLSDEDLMRRADTGEVLTGQELCRLTDYGRCPDCGRLPEAEPGFQEYEASGFHRETGSGHQDNNQSSSQHSRQHKGNPVLQAAFEWYDVGGNPAPAKEDGSKTPDLSRWTERRTKRNRREDLPDLFGNRTGIGTFLGPVFRPDNSGHEDYGIECFEFDSEAAYDAFLKSAEAAGLSVLVERIRTGYEERTPSGGVHLFYFCSTVEGNRKLAQETTGEVDKQGKPKLKTLIETRGKGGWAITSPSHGSVHASGKSYVRTQGSPATITHITPDERTALFDYAATFDTVPEHKRSESSGESTGPNQSTGHASRRVQSMFNKQTTWDGILPPHGWERIEESDTWRRPGAETSGKDATTDADGTDRLWVHSTSTVFQTGRYYTKFQAYTLLNHHGDHAAAESHIHANWDAWTAEAEQSGTGSGSGKTDGSNSRSQRFNASDLLRQKLDPPRVIVPNRLNDGLTISAGPPKVGKSWMKLALAVAVATGGEWLGETVTNPGAALYLALEDSPRRLQDRLQKVLYSDSGTFVIEGDTDDDMTFDFSNLPDMPDRLDIWTACPRLDKGGLQEIEGWLKDHADARLVIIDTLAKVRPPRSPNGNMYDDDYRALEGLQQLALKYGIAIVVVHHLRKMESSDPLERLSGSMAISGAADSIFVLTRERGKDTATLFITGRDVEHELELALSFDSHTVQWLVMGAAEEVRRSSEQKEVIDVLIEAREPLTPTEVADRLGLPRNRIKQRLYQMSKKNIVKNDKGKYSYATSK
jgi:hypothetical protein